ncbi:MAG: hypothetical protein ACI845_001090 [Gammaproteobacteria bacterium]|jgi:hypothetical protein
MSIIVLAPTGTLGYGFGAEALRRGMGLQPDVIAVDAGSTDPGPAYLGAAESLCSRRVIKAELTQLIAASRSAKIPLIVGSAGGSGRGELVDETCDIVREIVSEMKIKLKLAWIYADIEPSRVSKAIRDGDIQDFEAGFELTEADVKASQAIVAQMGWEPIAEALDAGADVVIAGRACDDLAIASYAIARGGDIALATHMGKILECGAFSAEPFAMDVMLGFLHDDHFILEPGSEQRIASLKSVAAHTLYEREDPFKQYGPGGMIDLSACKFKAEGDRRVRVSGAQFVPNSEHWFKLEGAKAVGYRTICIGGIRCPTMIERLDDLLAAAAERTKSHFAPDPLTITFRPYGKNAVMAEMEPNHGQIPTEIGLLLDVTAETQEIAHGACHFLSGHLLHVAYPGQLNTSGNLAFPYSPSDIDAGIAYEFSMYHLMRADSATELFAVHTENLS